MQLNIACIQLNSGDNMLENIDKLGVLVAKAAGQGAKLVATPENTFLMEAGNPHPGPLPGRERGKKYGQAGHPGITAAAQMAKRYGVWLLVGSVAVLDSALGIQDSEKTYNRSLLFAPDGSIAAQYDKIHLFDVEVGDGQTYKESARILPGDKLVLSDLCLVPREKKIQGTVKLGLSICYDLRFPQLYRALASKGAQILAVPSAFTQTTGEAHWHVLLRARAIENGCFVIAPAQCGTHPGGRKTYGHALIVDPWGTMLADGGTEEGVVMATLDLGEVEKARRRIPSLQHDRTFDLK
jgi:predicted amidohydrolase